MMPSVLTSWKEIGHYLGKGVRTVQRWEMEFGLPVRRPSGGSHRTILAIPQELDEWTRRQTRSSAEEAMEILRNEIAALRRETAALRNRLERVEKVPLGETRQWEEVRFSARVRAESIRVRLSFALTICAIGEGATVRGDSVQAKKNVERAERTTGKIRRSLELPGYVPAEEMGELRKGLKEVESRILRMRAGQVKARGRAGRKRPAVSSSRWSGSAPSAA